MASKYDLGTHHGVTMDRLTAQAVDAAMALVPASIRRRTRFTQGAPSYYDKSGGTHSGRGAIDLIIDGGTAAEYRIVENAFRRVGFAGWFREAIDGYWPRHFHAVLRGHPKLAYQAYLQVLSYLRGRNGLKGDGDDPNNYNPTNTYKYQEDNVPLTDKELDRIAKRILTYKVKGDKEAGIPVESLSERLLRTRASARETNASLRPGIPAKRDEGVVYSLLRRLVQKTGA